MNSGKMFEKKIIRILERAKPDMIKLQPAYVNLYGGRGRSDCLVNFEGVKFRIECRYQASKGSTDEKLVYALLNLIETECAEREDICILVVGGSGIRRGAIYFAKKYAKAHCKRKPVYVMNQTQLEKFLNRRMCN